MLRNWKADGEKVGLTFIEKVGNIIFFSKDGFTFKSYRTSWPPKKLSPGQCLAPTEYYKFLVRKLHGDLYDLSKTIFTGADDKVIATCKIHGDFTIAAKYLSSIRGCPTCAKEFSPRLKRGFIKSGENKNYASLYLIRCFDENEIFYKIGITTKPMNRRFGGESTLPYKYEVVNLFTANPEEIWDLEKIMHKVYKDVKYLPNKEFGGRYECFSYIDTAEYVKLLNCVA